MKEDKAPCSEKTVHDNGSVRLWKKVQILSVPSEVPPANCLQRDILWAQCKQQKLSTKGQKLDAYKELCEYAYPGQNNNAPITAKEAKNLTVTEKIKDRQEGNVPGTFWKKDIF